MVAVTPRVTNLHAFARVYGLVRWFHPSDAAGVVDWDRFAIDGARRVVDAPDAHELRARLTELFAPIAPTMHISGPGETVPEHPADNLDSTKGLDIVAWQHKGYGDTTIATGYTSKRMHRDGLVALPGPSFLALSQSIDATPLRGARVRLRGKLRTSKHVRGQLWLRVDRGDAIGFFDNMTNHPVVSESWVSAEIVGTVASDASRIVFGALNASRGTVWYDDLELAVAANDGAWRPIDITNAGFEEPATTGWQTGTGRPGASQSIEGWRVSNDAESPASGMASLRIEPVTKIVTEDLFVRAPVPGETVGVELGAGLRARLPIALYSRSGKTLGDDPDVARRAQATRGSVSPSGFDPVSGAADVIVLWNVFEHFWPYWNTVSVDWNAMLDSALAASLADHGVDDHVVTLERLVAGAPDGHVSPRCPGESERGYLPFAVDLIESQIVVTSSADRAVERGDVLVSVDGRAALQLLAAEQELISGSPQWRALRASRLLGRGPLGSSAALRLRRGTSELSETVQRVEQLVPEGRPQSAITRFDQIYYVDLSRATMGEIDQIIDRLATAPGVIFDLRHYPKHNHDVLSHILTRHETLEGWELVPLIIRPDSGSAPAAWEDTSTWNMPRLTERQPHIGGRVAFLTGPDAISYAESVMALVEYYHLGEIVGAPTAGTNGDIAEATLPTGCATLFTGRRVTKPDGRPAHLIGIQPTIPASRTIAGVIAGRDEVLDRALTYVRSGSR
jgi:hypothetical protein